MRGRDGRATSDERRPLVSVTDFGEGNVDVDGGREVGTTGRGAEWQRGGAPRQIKDPGHSFFNFWSSKSPRKEKSRQRGAPEIGAEGWGGGNRARAGGGDDDAIFSVAGSVEPPAPAKRLGTARYALLLALFYVLHGCGVILLVSLRLSSKWIKVIEILGYAEATLLAIALLMELGIRSIHKRHRAHGYIGLYRHLSIFLALPIRVTAIGAAGTLCVICADHFYPSTVALVLFLHLVQDVVCATAVASYARAAALQDFLQRPPDAMQVLNTSLRSSEYGNAASGSDLNERTLLCDVVSWQQDTILRLSHELMRMQERNRDIASQLPQSLGGGGTGLQTVFGFGHKGESKTTSFQVASYGATDEGKIGGGKSTNNAMELEVHALRAEREGILSDLRSARRHIAERDAEATRLRGVEAAHTAENSRMRAMLHEWSSRSAMLEKKLSQVVTSQTFS